MNPFAIIPKVVKESNRIFEDLDWDDLSDEEALCKIIEGVRDSNKISKLTAIDLSKVLVGKARASVSTESSPPTPPEDEGAHHRFTLPHETVEGCGMSAIIAGAARTAYEIHQIVGSSSLLRLLKRRMMNICEEMNLTKKDEAEVVFNVHITIQRQLKYKQSKDNDETVPVELTMHWMLRDIVSSIGFAHLDSDVAAYAACALYTIWDVTSHKCIESIESMYLKELGPAFYNAVYKFVNGVGPK